MNEKKTWHNYKILRHIGYGGMSDVFLAIDIKRQAKVALKVLEREAGNVKNTDFLKRADREASIMKSLRHPNIIRIYDSGRYDNRFFIAMEYLSGGDLLSNLLTDFTIEHIMNVLSTILDAIAYIHNMNIIHRDLKPSNILFKDKRTPVITDFGLSKLIQGIEVSLTRSDIIIGTLAYMSPEQKFNPKQTDKLSDIYSMGAVLYHLWTGHLPMDRFKSPIELINGFPAKLDHIIMKCLAVEKEARYSNAVSLKRDIEGLIKDPPVIDQIRHVIPLILANHQRKATYKQSGATMHTKESIYSFQKIISSLNSESIKSRNWAENQLKAGIDQYFDELVEHINQSKTGINPLLLIFLGFSKNKMAINILLKMSKIEEYKHYALISLIRLDSSYDPDHVMELINSHPSLETLNHLIDALGNSSHEKAGMILYEIYRQKPYLHVRTKVLDSFSKSKLSDKAKYMKILLENEKDSTLRRLILSIIREGQF